MTTRVVTFLGLGHADKPDHYDPAVYELDGWIAPFATPIHDVPTLVEYCRRDRELPSLVVLGTADVRRRWFGSDRRYAALLEAGLRQAGIEAAPEIELVELPMGRSSAELWDIFRTVVAALTDPRRAGEREPPGRIVLDITHGFRSQPFFAASAIAYVRSEWRRSTSADRKPSELPPELRILYAAFEARDPETRVAPILDLTQLLDAVAWNDAIEALMRYGRADDLERLAAGLQKDLNRAASPEDRFSSLRKLGESAKAFADGLATARLPQLMTDLSDSLARATESAREPVTRHVPPLEAQLERLRAWAEKIQAAEAVSLAGVAAGLELARLYGQLERFAEMAATLRETLVSAWTVGHRPSEAILQPDAAGGPAFDAQREEDERALSGAGRDRPAAAPLPRLAANVGDLRNDVEHCAFRPSPRKSSKIRVELPKLLDEAARLLAAAAEAPASPDVTPAPGGTLASTDPQTAGRFVCCSNHPVSQWSEAQARAAEAFGHGPPVDLDGGFPSVPPEADLRAVSALAEETADRIRRVPAAVAFVAGEQTLAFALVARLQAAGVRCVSATTERQATERLLPDGTTHREAQFQFVAFRDFPRLYAG